MKASAIAVYVVLVVGIIALLIDYALADGAIYVPQMICKCWDGIVLQYVHCDCPVFPDCSIF